MTDTLVPIEFELPSRDWGLASPETAERQGVLALAYGPAHTDWFTPNITVAGEPSTVGPDAVQDADLTDIADLAVRSLADDGAEVAVLRRRTIEGDDPGLLQMLRTAVTIDGELRQIRQLQAFLKIVDTNDPRTSVVYTFTLSTAEGELKTLGADFQQFLRTVRPVDRSA